LFDSSDASCDSKVTPCFVSDSKEEWQGRYINVTTFHCFVPVWFKVFMRALQESEKLRLQLNFAFHSAI
jgi:hypothetical protein